MPAFAAFYVFRLMKPALFASLLASTFAASAFAQPSDAPSLLGQRYVEPFVGYTDYNRFTSDFGLGATVNLPLSTSFDVGSTFLHNQQEGDDSQHYETLDAHLAAHRDLGPVRAFARATLGYEWWSVENLTWYRLDLGAERALSQNLLLSAHVSWQDFFSSDVLAGRFSVTGRATYWLTATTAASFSTAYLETGDLFFKLGVAFLF